MLLGASLHIGLNAVDPKKYSGWGGQLTACEFDANDMQALAKTQGFTKVTKRLTKRGDTQSVVLTACQESGYAYEYHHGTIGYGVFTYALAKEFRKAQTARETDVSLTELSERVNATMKTLRYDQISEIK